MRFSSTVGVRFVRTSPRFSKRMRKLESSLTFQPQMPHASRLQSAFRIFNRASAFPKYLIYLRFTCCRTFSVQKPVWPYLYSPKNTSMAPQLEPYFKQVDSLAEQFIDRLRSAVAIPSVSADEERRPDVVKVSCLKHCSHSLSDSELHRWVNFWPPSSRTWAPT